MGDEGHQVDKETSSKEEKAMWLERVADRLQTKPEVLELTSSFGRRCTLIHADFLCLICGNLR